MWRTSSPSVLQISILSNPQPNGTTQIHSRWTGMSNDKTYWLYTDTGLAALSDELTKIAADAEKKPHWGSEVAKGILGLGIGAGLGTGAAMLVEKALPKVFLEKNPNLAPMMKIVLPIMGATTSYVEQRLRDKLKETYKKAPGYNEDEK